MTIAPERSMLAACDCSGLLALCGHCACDRCEDCGECTGGTCVCECMRVERRALAALADRMPVFYLTTHMSNWLRTSRISLMVHRGRLKDYKTLPTALAPWVHDSQGFTELQRHGRHRAAPEEFVHDVRRFYTGIGNLVWSSPQDWMCEPWVITGQNWHLPPTHPKYFHGTREARGLPPASQPGENEQPFDDAVRFHQERTVENYLELKRLAPDLPFIPVLQGWELKHYDACAQLYADAGIDLRAEPVVGLGSVCRRQATDEIREIVEEFAGRGLRLHGFGVKTKGLSSYAHHLASADSAAWSMDARRKPPLPGHTHKNCANCPDFAYAWHQRIVAQHLTPAA
ncbi:DUF7221 family queuine tRNA-ribosyltransferase-like protein [Streptomyces bullii]|uniref:DeoxyPurine in DNA protein A domain-containing protein n=1 Tax=Streptomyces bullii TaxID=349910 RepID=A0ABW0UR31_9ACTN